MSLSCRCLQRYLILTQSTSPSLTQLSVLETLTYHVSGVTSVRSEVAISGGLFTVDALVTYHAVEVVVEVDGPSHFFLNRSVRSVGSCCICCHRLPRSASCAKAVLKCMTHP